MRCAPVRYERCCSQQRRPPVSNGSRLTTATAEPLDRLDSIDRGDRRDRRARHGERRQDREVGCVRLTPGLTNACPTAIWHG